MPSIPTGLLRPLRAAARTPTPLGNIGQTAKVVLSKPKVMLTSRTGAQHPAMFSGYQDWSTIGRGRPPTFTALHDIPGGPSSHSTWTGPNFERQGFKLPDPKTLPNPDAWLGLAPRPAIRDLRVERLKQLGR